MTEIDEDASFLKDCNVPVLVNEIMCHLLATRPTDVVGGVIEFLNKADRTKYGPGKGGASPPTTDLKPKTEEEPPAAPESKETAEAEAPELGEDLEDFSAFKGDLNAELTKKLAGGATRINISKNSLTELPPPLLNQTNVTELSIEENHFINMDGLLTMTGLVYLNISDNPKFKEIPEGFATKLPKLVKLDAYKCGFSGQLSDELAGCSNMTHVNFYNNSILKPFKCGGLKSLIEFNLSSNKIMAVPEGSFECLQNVKRLALFWNRLLKVPSLAPLTSLKELQLNGNQLPEMPELGVHDELEEINLSENKIAKLHESLFNQKNLEVFAAGKNLLTNESILSNWPKIENIKKIHFPDNQLTSIPDVFLDLPNLIVLELNKNQIKTLPADIDRFEKKTNPLNHLFLAENPFETLPTVMGDLQSLKRIAFRGCPLDMTDETTKTTYEKLEAIIKTKGIEGKFLDSKRTGTVQRKVASGPTTLGTQPGVGGGGGSGAEMKKKKRPEDEGVPPNEGGVTLAIG
eukprot:TRINITY_DN6181_c0_g1_i1.p1 TRINITY_DN6181_c0_g1~~TRINITY_DN6181_c0_g1_i1.p1  ORF type:complete len:534 (+),score=119.58 TRINITY_DN6181_c0_g1_i1:51-1604(+)